VPTAVVVHSDDTGQQRAVVEEPRVTPVAYPPSLHPRARSASSDRCEFAGEATSWQDLLIQPT
jgi:hypothetical protein